MNENFKISPSEINKIKVLNQKDKNFRLENLKLFNQQGFPTRNHEDWKFSDINKDYSEIEAWYYGWDVPSGVIWNNKVPHEIIKFI